MKKSLSIPDSISSRLNYKRKYNLAELFIAFALVPGAAFRLIKNSRKNLVDKKFVERLQLAVTEVNGCAACSYAHAYMALKKGMSSEEVYSFLNGDNKFVAPEEAKAVLFAQHFADSRGLPEKVAFIQIVNEYGSKKAGIILAAVQIMIAGNIYGIPYSAFQSRLKGEKYKNSSLFYELSMLVIGAFLIPFSFVFAFLRSIIGLPNRRKFR